MPPCGCSRPCRPSRTDQRPVRRRHALASVLKARSAGVEDWLPLDCEAGYYVGVAVPARCAAWTWAPCYAGSIAAISFSSKSGACAHRSTRPSARAVASAAWLAGSHVKPEPATLTTAMAYYYKCTHHGEPFVRILMRDGAELVCCWEVLDILDELVTLWDAIVRITKADVVPDFEACAEVFEHRGACR